MHPDSVGQMSRTRRIRGACRGTSARGRAWSIDLHGPRRQPNRKRARGRFEVTASVGPASVLKRKVRVGLMIRPPVLVRGARHPFGDLLISEIASGSAERQVSCRKTAGSTPNKFSESMRALSKRTTNQMKFHDDVDIIGQHARQHVRISGRAIHSRHEAGISGRLPGRLSDDSLPSGQPSEG